MKNFKKTLRNFLEAMLLYVHTKFHSILLIYQGPDRAWVFLRKRTKKSKFAQIWTILLATGPEIFGQKIIFSNINKTYLVLPEYQFLGILKHFWPF